MPAFNDPADIKAKEIIQSLYPDREVVQIYSREILLGGGNIHCITQQVPK
jgi:agmatine deiminase